MIGKVQLIQLEGCKCNTNTINNNQSNSYSIYAQEREVVYIPKDNAKISLTPHLNQSENTNPNGNPFITYLEIKNKANSKKNIENIAKLSFHSKGKCTDKYSTNSFSVNLFCNKQ